MDCSPQAPLSMGFSRQEHWSGLPFPPPGDLPDPGVEPTSPALAGGLFTTEPSGKHKIGTIWEQSEGDANPKRAKEPEH